MENKESTSSWEKELLKYLTTGGATHNMFSSARGMTVQLDDSFESLISKELELERQKAKEETLAMVLKEIEEFREKCSGFNHAIQALDILKEKLQAKQ